MGTNLTCSSATLVPRAYAYLDPSVMSYTIQIIAGVVVVVGAIVGIYWRRAKRKVQERLGIDENANKEVEEDVVAIDEDVQLDSAPETKE